MVLCHFYSSIYQSCCNIFKNLFDSVKPGTIGAIKSVLLIQGNVLNQQADDIFNVHIFRHSRYFRFVDLRVAYFSAIYTFRTMSSKEIYCCNEVMSIFFSIQDLSKLGRDLHNVVIIDNSPASYIFHPENAVRMLMSFVYFLSRNIDTYDAFDLWSTFGN